MALGVRLMMGWEGVKADWAWGTLGREMSFLGATSCNLDMIQVLE